MAPPSPAPARWCLNRRPFSSLRNIVSAFIVWFSALPRIAAARALEPNVFYEPAFALEAAAVFGASAGAVLVWSGTAPRKLLGFFPARIDTRRYGVRLPVLTGWTHPYAPLGTPLVEREAAEPVIAAWLAHIADNKALPGIVLLPYVRPVSPFAAELHTILQRGRIPAVDLNI